VREQKRSATVSVPLVAGDELLGLLRAEGARAAELELARAVANQAAVAIRRST
jgi:GAF domain-containing protein